MIKYLILTIGFISTINASQRLLQQVVGCESIRCGGTCTNDATGRGICCSDICEDGVTECREAPAGNLCLDSCGANEVFRFCGTACEPTCDSPNPGICIALCKDGCFCDTGFILSDERVNGGQCIAQCPLQTVSCSKNNECAASNFKCRGGICVDIEEGSMCLQDEDCDTSSQVCVFNNVGNNGRCGTVQTP